MTSVMPTSSRVWTDADFESVYRSQAPIIYRFCLSQLRDPAAAEDAAADVFAAAFRSWHRVDPRLGVNQWLFRIARNVVSDHHRASRRRELVRSLLGRTHATSPVPDPEITVTLREDVVRLGAAIARLKRRDRILIGLRLSADLSHADIGDIVGISEEAARVAVHRALKAVRRDLEANP